MSKSASSATLFPAWKQEVNRRVAAHMSHKAPYMAESKTARNDRPAYGNRAALAAARVAQRYAQAPSYSEILADEARNAMRAAEAASKAAQQAQAAVQCMLDGLEAAAAPELVQQPEFEASNAPAPPQAQTPEPRIFDARSSFSAQKQPENAQWLEDDSRAGDPGEPIYANLIRFPRQMVATRRMRPRRAEGPLAGAPPQPQLSIFEVDPASISTQPAPSLDGPAAPVWMRAQESSRAIEPQSVEHSLEEAAPRETRTSIKPAPLSRRLMALVVDASLILAAFLSLAFLCVSHVDHLPGLRAAEIATAFAVLAIGAAYLGLFLVFAHATPGMRYAGIALSDFEGKYPDRAQCYRRLAATLLSVLSLGSGLVWALFDEDRLMGHDRLSKTYLRMR